VTRVTVRDGGRSERVSYREAGAAQRAASARANQLADRLAARDHRALCAVFAETTTYSKLTAFVYVEQIAELAGLDRSDAGKSIRKLAELGIIVWVPGRGRQSKSLIGVPATTEKRGYTPPSIQATEKGGTHEPETRVPVTPPTRREQENEKKAKAIAIEKAGRQALSASPARASAKARCAADAALPAEGFELEDEQEQSFWVGGETPTVPAYPASALSADRQSAATTVAELEELGDGGRQVGGVAGYSAPGNSEPTVGASHGDVPPELRLALPAGLNRDVVRLAAEHFETTPLAVLNHAERAAALGREPERLFAASFGRAVENDELGGLQARLVHEAADPEPSERPKTITGCRQVRGSHSSRCVFDPLGTDQPPHDWPHPKPTYEQILEARNASQPDDTEPRYEPQLLANARAFYTTFQHDYPPNAMREELELRYPTLGPGDVALIVGTPIDTPPPSPERADPEPTEPYEELPDHEQDELDRLHTEYGKAHARLDQERRDAINRDTP